VINADVGFSRLKISKVTTTLAISRREYIMKVGQMNKTGLFYGKAMENLHRDIMEKPRGGG
jgi:hypothetical protein